MHLFERGVTKGKIVIIKNSIVNINNYFGFPTLLDLFYWLYLLFSAWH